MEILGSLRRGKYLVRMDKNEIAKIAGYDQDSQVVPAIEEGVTISISSRWNLIKLLKGKKNQLMNISSELKNISENID